MEFLSTGEKIKRSRVYRGITLKELCKSDISISKMSCIENDKVKADEKTLKIISERLDMDLDYLLHDDKTELIECIEKYENSVVEDNEINNLLECIEYAELKEYNDIAFSLMHIVFQTYTKTRRFEKIKDLLPKYEKLYEKNSCIDIGYYEDLASYFFVRGKYNDSITYLNRIINIIDKEITNNKPKYIKAMILISACCFRTKKFDKCYEIVDSLMEADLLLGSEVIEAIGYGELAALKLRNGKDATKDLKKFEIIKDTNKEFYSRVKICIADSYLEIGNKNKVNEEILEIKKHISLDNKWEYAEILLDCTDILISNNQIDLAESFSEEVLGIAINLNNYVLIEKSYYYKSKICKIKGNFIQWEMNMNLATDILTRFATLEEKHDRYLEMANMYHLMGETREAIKYLLLSMNLEREQNY